MDQQYIKPLIYHVPLHVLVCIDSILFPPSINWWTIMLLPVLMFSSNYPWVFSLLLINGFHDRLPGPLKASGLLASGIQYRNKPFHDATSGQILFTVPLTFICGT